MRIVILDGMEMGAENLVRLRERGEVRTYSGMPKDVDELVARACDADVVIDSWTRMDDVVFARLPHLRMVSLAATGTDLIDTAAAARHGVTVCRVPSYATVAVAELALSLMLAVARAIPAVDREVRRRGTIEWEAPAGGELRGKTLGVLGTGAIGRQVARFGRCLGMTLLGHDPAPDTAVVGELGLRYVPPAELFAASDVLTVHAPLTAETQGFVDEQLLRLMKPGAVLVNTARAGLLDQDALCVALLEGRLGGAGLDDVDLTLPSGRQLLALDNVVLTPHIGFKTREAVANLCAVCTENVLRFLDGEACNVVTAPLL